MTIFTTEFPTSTFPSQAAFVGQVVAWLRGMQSSTVLDDQKDTDIEGDSAYLSSKDGEELRFRIYRESGKIISMGFRHDLPDKSHRLWRTEGVLRGPTISGSQPLLRVRTQCIAQRPGAHLETPLKPYLIKTLLRENWGGLDGILSVTDKPLWLKSNSDSLKIALEVTKGKASQHLPAFYVSSINSSRWLLSQDLIEKLAYDLGGVAHIVVEPDRPFSFGLRDQSSGGNAYGGAIGISVPEHGIIRRLYFGWYLRDENELANAIYSTAFALRGQMPAQGWDWTELQEQALRSQRERDRKRLSAEESEELYIEEIKNLKEQIAQLKSQLGSLVPTADSAPDGGDFFAPLIKQIGPEIYEGEYVDRIRFAAESACNSAERTGLDRRSSIVLQAIAQSLPKSPALYELREDLKRATKDSGGIASKLVGLLSRHGYQKKSDNKHVRLEAKEGFIGLDSLTLPKTPSDGRGLTNLRKEIEGALGLKVL